MYIEKMPKAELHCHFDGSIPIKTLYKLAVRNNIDPNIMDNVFAAKKCDNLNDYLNSFDSALTVLQTKEDLIDATYDLIESVSQENVKYIEIRLAPLLHIRGGLTVEEVINHVTEGVKKANQNFDIFVNLLICCMRNHKSVTNSKLISDTYKSNNDLIVGFDFAGNEEDGANEFISDLTESIKGFGFQLTLHSGECGCAHNIAQAINLGATRIGHGVAIRDKTDLISLVQEKDVHFELCLTSNYQTNAITDYHDFPLRLFLDNNISCSINTDNRTVSNTTLTKEFKKVKKIFEITNEEIYKLSINAIEHSFAGLNVKQQVESEMTLFYEQSRE